MSGQWPQQGGPAGQQPPYGQGSQQWQGGQPGHGQGWQGGQPQQQWQGGQPPQQQKQWQGGQPPHPQWQGGQPQGPKKAPVLIIGLVGVLVLALVGGGVWWLLGRPQKTVGATPVPAATATSAESTPTTRSSSRTPASPSATANPNAGRKKAAGAKLPETLSGGFTRDHNLDSKVSERAMYKTSDRQMFSVSITESRLDNSFERIERNEAFVPFERVGDDVTCGQSKLSDKSAVCFMLLDGGYMMGTGLSGSKQATALLLREAYTALP